MGQKVNPHGFRVGVIKDWDSRWFAKDNVFGDTLVEDYNLRKTLKKQLAAAGVPKIEIERDASKAVSYTHLDVYKRQIVRKTMYDTALARRESMTYTATTLDELKEIAENKPGFIKAMWCGDQACEEKLKEVAGVSSRCMPFEQEHLADTCVCCGKPAKAMVYWGKAY